MVAHHGEGMGSELCRVCVRTEREGGREGGRERKRGRERERGREITHCR